MNISPKVIDVEGNRIETDDKLFRKTTINKNNKNNINIISSKRVGSMDDKCKNGRFPTQLFTNIKNERYKYVKTID